MLMLLAVATQLLKLALYCVAQRRLNLRVLVMANGMPSLHAVVFMAAAITAGLDQGFGSPLFVVSWIFGGIVLHDLIKIQGSVGKGQATGLFLARAIEVAEPGSWSARWAALLSDRGHRPLHVAAGMVLGALTAIAWARG